MFLSEKIFGTTKSPISSADFSPPSFSPRVFGRLSASGKAIEIISKNCLKLHLNTKGFRSVGLLIGLS
jgi:hypothetical protein